MNRYLENIYKLLQDINLSESEKQLLLKAVTDAGKEWAITDFKLGHAEKVKKTTAVLLEETIVELQQKRKAVEAQKRELEIESSLERVRTVAMGMIKREDMLDICRIISGQLELLQVPDIRNVQTAIVDEAKHIYLNYEYYRNHNKTFITEVDYTIHPVQSAFAQQMLKGKGSFFSTSLEGEKLHEFIEHQKAGPEFVDTFLFESVSLTWYWASLGPIAFGISTYSPLDEENQEIVKRFRNVFDLSYRRYLDIEKAAAQSREAQIEASLERVRAQALGMRKAEELPAICEVLYKELYSLGFAEIRNAMVNIHDDGKGTFINYDYSDEIGKSTNHLRYDIHPVIEKQIRQMRSAGDAFSETFFKGKDLEDWKDFRKKIGEKDDSRIESTDALYYYFYSIGTGSIGISTFSAVTEEKLNLLKRFRNVFNLAYKRYVDISNAEAQSREARVEVALERVRARTMAMQKSEELPDASLVLFQQLKDLGEPADQLSIGIVNEAEDIVEVTATLHGKPLQYIFRHRIDEPILMNKIYNSWKAGQRTLVVDITGDELQTYNRYRDELTGTKIFTGEQHRDGRRSVHSAFFSKGMLALATNESRPPESLQLLERFAKVFDGTYTRFLDLQKAETQAREAQIEASLERVRSKTMAMHNSQDVSVATAVMFNELVRLGVENMRSGIAILKDSSTMMDVWTATITKDGHHIKGGGLVDTNRHPLWQQMYNDWKSKKENFLYHLKGEDLKAYYNALTSSPDYSASYINEDPPEHYCYITFFDDGVIFTFNSFQYADEQKQVLKRFASVFNLTYRRYLDLQKAEVQAREAQIEMALEKVRSRAMAMQKPGELVEVAELLRKEMGVLGIEELETSSIYIHHADTQNTECWYAIKDVKHPERKLVSDHMNINLADTSVGKQMLSFHQSAEKKISIPMQGQVRKEWMNYCAGHSKVLVNYYGDDIPDRTYHLYKFSNGFMGAASPGDISAESWDLLKRTTAVFSLAYTRFSDLQQSEAQVGEAAIEVALERVRSRTLAMQKSDELAETAAVLFKQLIGLGIAPNRLYIGIVKDEIGHIEFWVTGEDGSKVSTQFIGDAERNVSMKKMYTGWKKQKKSLTIDMKGKELQNYFHYLADELNVPFKQGLQQKRRIQTIAFFGKGFIGIASPDDQPEETTLLLERFAAVFNLTYTRFNDLKLSEAHAIQAEEDLIKLQTEKKRAEDALGELRATQTQLIQSEKMASLGELTAGIAHEIQNPLNFVNNFSEVSNELIDEMYAEIEKGDMQEAKVIANDIKQNLEKINHHGKRADAIVKSMLQHSRSTGAVKELTDLNKLSDEYLRLAYHGLRAKDPKDAVHKSFNATLKTDYDETLEKINIIPQDIGRVILNLITNAFYAVQEKQTSFSGKSGLKDLTSLYQPTVSISTKRLHDNVEIKVADNGNGIPQNIIDKIFQPFFTTKPTGQGTGLGLSLAYDIVKAHGGELKVETKEGEHSVFIIELPLTGNKIN